jgi:hypothetical protein
MANVLVDAQVEEIRQEVVKEKREQKILAVLSSVSVPKPLQYDGPKLMEEVYAVVKTYGYDFGSGICDFDSGGNAEVEEYVSNICTLFDSIFKMHTCQVYLKEVSDSSSDQLKVMTDLVRQLYAKLSSMVSSFDAMAERFQKKDDDLVELRRILLEGAKKGKIDFSVEWLEQGNRLLEILSLSPCELTRSSY